MSQIEQPAAEMGMLAADLGKKVASPTVDVAEKIGGLPSMTSRQEVAVEGAVSQNNLGV